MRGKEKFCRRVREPARNIEKLRKKFLMGCFEPKLKGVGLPPNFAQKNFQSSLLKNVGDIGSERHRYNFLAVSAQKLKCL